MHWTGDTGEAKDMQEYCFSSGGHLMAVTAPGTIEYEIDVDESRVVALAQWRSRSALIFETRRTLSNRPL